MENDALITSVGLWLYITSHSRGELLSGRKGGRGDTGESKLWLAATKERRSEGALLDRHPCPVSKRQVFLSRLQCRARARSESRCSPSLGTDELGDDLEGHGLWSLDGEAVGSVPDQLSRGHRSGDTKDDGVVLELGQAVVVEEHARSGVDVGEGAVRGRVGREEVAGKAVTTNVSASRFLARPLLTRQDWVTWCLALTSWSCRAQ